MSVCASVILTYGLDVRLFVSHSNLLIGCPLVRQSFWLIDLIGCPSVILANVLDVRQSFWLMDWKSVSHSGLLI